MAHILITSGTDQEPAYSLLVSTAATSGASVSLDVEFVPLRVEHRDAVLSMLSPGGAEGSPGCGQPRDSRISAGTPVSWRSSGRATGVGLAIAAGPACPPPPSPTWPATPWAGSGEGTAQTPPDHREDHPPPLLQRRVVAGRRDRPVQSEHDAHHALPLPGSSHPGPMASQRMNHHGNPCGACGEPGAGTTGTPGSGGDSGKPTSRNTGRAPRVDLTRRCRLRNPTDQARAQGLGKVV
jgi:hypothetical protein